ncbi:hypothetical protein [Candidatus Pyrohabitans sp.]
MYLIPSTSTYVFTSFAVACPPACLCAIFACSGTTGSHFSRGSWLVAQTKFLCAG